MAHFLATYQGIITKLAVPCLLALVATVQVLTALQTPLSPWKCGGFGMFSDIQQPANRTVLAWVRIDGKLSPARIPLWLERQHKTVQTMPTEENLSSLLAILAKLDWGNAAADLSAEISEPGELPTEARQDIIVGIAFEVRYSIDAETGKRQIFSEQLCRLTQPLAPVGGKR